MSKLEKILAKVTNTKSILAIAGAIVLILTTLGIKVDSEEVMTVVKAACSILVLMGIINDTGMATTKWNDKIK